MNIHIDSMADIDRAAREFLKLRPDGNVLAFYGPMGAGKTTFIAALCRAMGVTDDISSPTFSIVNEYLDADGNTIYHFDCYRFDSPEDALDIGISDYFDSGRICLIEWPENLGPLLPEDAIAVNITELPDGSRTVTTDA